MGPASSEGEIGPASASPTFVPTDPSQMFGCDGYPASGDDQTSDSDYSYNPDNETEESSCEEEFYTDEMLNWKPAKSTQPKPVKFATPAEDANPSRPSASQNQGSGWTSNLHQVPVHDFTGEDNEPVGPQFRPQRRPVDYFLMFFLLVLFTYIAEMTSIKLLSKGYQANNS